MSKAIYAHEQALAKARAIENNYWKGIALANHNMEEGDFRFRLEWVLEAKTYQTVVVAGTLFRFKIARIPSRTGISSDNKWDAQAKHYQVTMAIGDNPLTYTFEYSHGSGWGDGNPDYFARASDIVMGIISDASAGIQGFEDFCDNCGMDSDSRKATRVWEASKAVTRFFNKVGVSDSQIEKMQQLIYEEEDI